MMECHRLCNMDLRRAIYWWRQKLNTAEIAEKLDIDEASVANSLAHWREEEYRKKRLEKTA